MKNIASVRTAGRNTLSLIVQIVAGFGMALVAVLSIGTFYVSGITEDISRILLVTLCCLSFTGVLVTHYFAPKVFIAGERWRKPVIMVGAGRTAELLTRIFATESYLGYRVVGFVDVDCTSRLIREPPYMGNYEQLETIIKKSAVKEVIIAVPGLKRDSLLNLIRRIQPLITRCIVVPDLTNKALSDLEPGPLISHLVMLFKTSEQCISGLSCTIKRVFDMTAGFILLFFSLPLMAIIALLIKLDSRGPILYLAKRIGKDGSIFCCYKFRTMYQNSQGLLEVHLREHPESRDEWEKYAKLRSFDPRLTKIGRWLRRYSLDELPQFLNVIRGEMSLVGPRPYLPEERQRMSYVSSIILQVVPGVTGLWQVNGRNSIEFEGRLILDAWYVHNWSIWLDFVLLIKTVKTVLTGRGAY